VPTSEGKRHCVREGTRLLTHFSIVTRDPKFWQDPEVFKVERFKPLPEPELVAREGHKEPLPVISFGCPLGKLFDESSAQNTHRCAFVHLAQPFMCEFIRKLLEGFNWELSSSDAVARAVGQKKKWEIPFSPELLRGGAADQNTPKVDGTQKCRISKKK
jgi:cytochrome P450